MNYKQRVLIELLELNKKINDLSNYMKDKGITEILEKQLSHMQSYSDVLVERILIMLEEKEPIN